MNKCLHYNEAIKKMALHAPLPHLYQPVEYLQSTGTQYIDTGIVNWTNQIEYEIKVSIEEQAEGSIRTYFGAYNIWASYGKSLPVISTWMGYREPSSFDAGYVESSGTSIGIQTGQIGTISLRGTILSWSEGSNLVFNRGTNFTHPVSIYLFCQNINGTASEHANFKMYSAKIWENSSTLSRNFIPCYRKSDNVAGMYDTVSKTFFTNAGTGTFIVGPNI